MAITADKEKTTMTTSQIAVDYMNKLRGYDMITIAAMHGELVRKSARTRNAQTRAACDFMADCCRIILAEKR